MVKQNKKYMDTHKTPITPQQTKDLEKRNAHKIVEEVSVDLVLYYRILMVMVECNHIDTQTLDITKAH